LHIKTLKEKGKFLYSVTLTAFISGQSCQIVRVDNYHDGKNHHMHHFNPDGSETKKYMSIKNFQEACDCIAKDWVRFVLNFQEKINKR